jgi:hypothetical protein
MLSPPRLPALWGGFNAAALLTQRYIKLGKERIKKLILCMQFHAQRCNKPKSVVTCRESVVKLEKILS